MPIPDAHDETGQAQDGVEVAAGQPEQGAPGAAEEDQGSDHGEHAEHETDDGCGTGPGTEVLGRQGSRQGAQDEADDFRAHVLDHSRPVQADGAGDVPLEAGPTQMPMLAGLPRYCRREARIPMANPTKMMPPTGRQYVFHPPSPAAGPCLARYLPVQRPPPWRTIPTTAQCAACCASPRVGWLSAMYST